MAVILNKRKRVQGALERSLWKQTIEFENRKIRFSLTNLLILEVENNDLRKKCLSIRTNTIHVDMYEN
ncbi:hypothetical protein CDAR_77361 [Caerostris darwini]|uniref:Ribosomal protein L20 n=1 Tax=Caerostris darwini TaxID=1538125 RepID=A0AAV4TMF3_9ARAC|nr:hypothetical protein CDAR_77361 [Caerostris darwini]